MQSIKKAILFGFLIWLIMFLVSFFIFPLRESNRALFESIMPVVGTIAAVIFAVIYFKNIEGNFLKEGIWLGIIWFVINIVIDLLLFMWGPMKMTFCAYMADIGLTYLLIPAITIGFGELLALKVR
jgi:hypothetical protein